LITVFIFKFLTCCKYQDCTITGFHNLSNFTAYGVTQVRLFESYFIRYSELFEYFFELFQWLFIFPVGNENATPGFSLLIGYFVGTLFFLFSIVRDFVNSFIHLLVFNY